MPPINQIGMGMLATAGKAQKSARVPRTFPDEQRKALESECDNLLQRAEVKLRDSWYDDSRRDFVAASELARTLGDRERLAYSYMKTIQCLTLLTRYDEAIEIFRNAQPGLRLWENKAVRATMYGGVSNVYRIKGEYATARMYALKALSIYRDLDNQLNVGAMFVNIAAIYIEQLVFWRAEPYLRDAIQIFQRQNRKDAEANARIDYAKALLYREEFSSAFEQTEIALELGKAIGNRYFEALALNTRSLIHRRLAQYDEAILQMELALEILRWVGQRRFLAIVCLNLSGLYNRVGRLEEAQTIIEEALQLSAETDPFLLGNALRAKGVLFQYSERRDEAVTLFLQARNRFETSEQPSECAATDGVLGVYYAEIGDSETARRYFTAFQTKPPEKTGSRETTSLLYYCCYWHAVWGELDAARELWQTATKSRSGQSKGELSIDMLIAELSIRIAKVERSPDLRKKLAVGFVSVRGNSIPTLYLRLYNELERTKTPRQHPLGYYFQHLRNRILALGKEESLLPDLFPNHDVTFC